MPSKLIRCRPKLITLMTDTTSQFMIRCRRISFSASQNLQNASSTMPSSKMYPLYLLLKDTAGLFGMTCLLYAILTALYAGCSSRQRCCGATWLMLPVYRSPHTPGSPYCHTHPESLAAGSTRTSEPLQRNKQLIAICNCNSVDYRFCCSRIL